MPVFKVPIRHKFGILPLARAQEILARSNQSPKVQRENSHKAPILEIDSTFVTKYNESCESDKRKLDEVLRRVLQYAKFKAQLKPCLSGSSRDSDPTDIQAAWMEMAIVCQCSGPFEEEALLALTTSLAHAPICPSQVPSLLYIAGLSYRWLKSDAVDGPLLRSGELLLLKILYLASLRIYMYHLMDTLSGLCTGEEVQQLKSDIDGFENRERTYRNFPEPLLHWKVALEVGLLVCEHYSHMVSDDPALLSAFSLGDSECDAEGSPQNVASQPKVVPKKGHSSLHPTLWHALDVWQCVRQGSSLLEESLKDLLACCSAGFDAEYWLENVLAMDILCAAAEVNIKVLHFVQDLAKGCTKEPCDQEGLRPHPSCEGAAGQVPSNLRAQGSNGSPKKGAWLAGDSGVDDGGKETTRIMGHQARTPQTLNILGMQPNFKEGTATDLTLTHPEQALLVPTTPSKLKVTFKNWGSSRKTPYTPDSVRTQSLIEDESIPNTPVSIDSSSTNVDLVHHSPSPAGELRQPTATITSLTTPGPTPCETQTKGNRLRLSGEPGAASGLGTMASAAVSTPMEEKLLSLLSPTSAVGAKCHEDVATEGARGRKGDSRCTHYTHSVAALSGWDGGGGRGSQMHPSTVYVPSFVSLPPVLGSEEEGGELRFKSRFELWPCEVCVTYTINMASIAIFGRTSAIQESALNGRRGQEVSEHGLVQLAGFESDLDGTGLSSWAIRFVALLGLSRVCRVCSKMHLKDGMSALAWSRLVEAHATERDSRVMEAYKTRQVSVDIDSSLLEVGHQPSSLPVIAHIADTLSLMFLPSVTPTTRQVLSNHQRSVPVLYHSETSPKISTTRPKVDTGLNGRRTGAPPTSYISRTTTALQSVAEEHWRRQMSLERDEQISLSDSK